jgi:NAD kinase
VTLAPRAVLVHRRTEYTELLERHGTRGQAAFFLSSRGRDLTQVEASHAAAESARRTVAAAIPAHWRRGEVERGDLDRFLFAPDDVIICVGQDGLVANVAKYLDRQVVLGVNAEPERNSGVLVRHHPGEAAGLLHLIDTAAPPPESTAPFPAGEAGSDPTRRLGGRVRLLTMVEVRSDDGQVLVALNEVYIGDAGHQTSRYQLRAPGPSGPVTERQASSGLLVGTGTGATGWCRSAWWERRSQLDLPAPDDRALAWFVREAWPSPITGTACTEGLMTASGHLELIAESERMVVFGVGWTLGRPPPPGRVPYPPNLSSALRTRRLAWAKVIFPSTYADSAARRTRSTR